MKIFTRKTPCKKGHHVFYENTDICVACDREAQLKMDAKAISELAQRCLGVVSTPTSAKNKNSLFHVPKRKVKKGKKKP